jgi:hypothetical protein
MLSFSICQIYFVVKMATAYKITAGCLYSATFTELYMHLHSML